MSLDIQRQTPALNASLQGLGSTVNRLQGQSSTLNATLQAGINLGSTLQGANYNPQKHASGTAYARGGWSWVGEQGPEMVYLPQGSQVRTNNQSKGPSSGSRPIVIHNLNLPPGYSLTQLFRELNQDTLNLGKGLTPIQGAYNG